MMLAVLLLLASCQDDPKFGSKVSASDLKFSVTQKPGFDNEVYLSSQTPGTIPYWDYKLGNTNKAQDTLILPFQGTYNIKYYAFGAGGYTEDSVSINVSQPYAAYFADPRWQYLSNGTEGKTWVLNFDHPLAFYGTTYGVDGSNDNWSWLPDYAGNEWVMPEADYGEMTFDLNAGPNYQVTMYKNGKPVTCKGTFTLDLDGETIKFNGCEMLHSSNYDGATAGFGSARIFTMTADEISFGVLRTVSPAYLAFRFKVK